MSCVARVELVCYSSGVLWHALVSQLVEEAASKSAQCGFESHRGGTLVREFAEIIVNPIVGVIQERGWHGCKEEVRRTEYQHR